MGSHQESAMMRVIMRSHVKIIDLLMKRSCFFVCALTLFLGRRNVSDIAAWNAIPKQITVSNAYRSLFVEAVSTYEY